MSTPTLMPAAFIGHGSPMNTFEDNRYTRAWRSFASTVPHPRAVLVVSAHWYTSVTAITAMAAPRTIHDLYGFGPRLESFQYPCPGSPEIAREVREVLKPRYLGLDNDAWGLDHGAWSVLANMFPNADVPVLQLSVNGTKDFDYHVDIGSRLSPLRERGILIIASGNVLHNLARAKGAMKDTAFDWGVRFNEAAKELMTTNPAEAATLRAHPDFGKAAEAPDHFIPLLYLAGLAKAVGRSPKLLVDGYAMGTLSMASYILDAECPQPQSTDTTGSHELPADVPPDQTNM